jgi:hypothetical protein
MTHSCFCVLRVRSIYHPAFPRTGLRYKTCHRNGCPKVLVFGKNDRTGICNQGNVCAKEKKGGVTANLLKDIRFFQEGIIAFLAGATGCVSIFYRV